MTDPTPETTPTRDEAVPFPAYGELPFAELGSAVKAAQYGAPEPYPFDPEFFPGHQVFGPINFNSLNRIVTWFVKRALASAPAPASGRVDAVKVEPLKFVRPPNAETLIKAETILGDACIWTHHEANGAWFWKLGDLASGTEASKGDAHKMLVSTYEHRIRSALSPAATPVSEAGGEP